MSNFRFAASSVLLTYSQISDAVTKEAVYFTIDERYPIKTFVVGEESHEDGGRHIHAALTFQRKVCSTDPGLFDVHDGDAVHHPNIAIIKRGRAHLDRARDYCRKEDEDPLTNVLETLTWGEMRQVATSVDEYMNLVQENYPRDFALSYDRLKSMAKQVWDEDTANTILQYEIPDQVSVPVELITTDLDLQKSIVVVGPAGIGKTCWAKSVAPKPTLFVRHLDSLKLLQARHRSIIFDDLEFQHLPPHTQKFLVDVKDLAEIHVRYNVARIPAGIIRIFTANEYPFSQGGIHGPAIERRIQLINL